MTAIADTRTKSEPEVYGLKGPGGCGDETFSGSFTAFRMTAIADQKKLYIDPHIDPR
jgi:hypothetical protein